MSRIIRYRPLDGLGEVWLDLDACPRRFPLFEQDRTHPDFPEEGPVKITLYLTPEGRWVEHTEEYDPWEGNRPCERFREVTPAYVIPELGLLDRRLPPDLAMLDPFREAMRKAGPWILYGPRAEIKPAPQPEGESKPSEAPAANSLTHRKANGTRWRTKRWPSHSA